MSKIIVLGAGMVGGAMAIDLAYKHEVCFNYIMNYLKERNINYNYQ